jgi:hypothetical protein
MGRGALLFKGEEKSTKKKKSKAKHQAWKDNIEQKVPTAAVTTTRPQYRLDRVATHAAGSKRSAAPAQAASAQSAQKPEATPTLKTPVGEITTSGTVVTGYDTRFTRDVSVGDALIVTIDGKQEMRVVTMRLSDMSLNLSSAFSQNVSVAKTFQVIAKPKNVAQETRKQQLDALQNAKDEEQQAFGTYGTTEELVYREKTANGSYRIKREKVQGGQTRGDLLSMRAKKKSDKYC